MPIIKHIPIHNAPKEFIEYIKNGEKTDKAKYLTGLNISTDTIGAYKEFKMTFESCTGERFKIQSDEENSGKQKVRLHHYVQSFSPDENISPEEAHEIGIEWAKRVFGENHQVIISTHIDKGHIHNHFAVAAYDLERKHWYDNMKTLKMCRKISDEIAIEHGLSVIENPLHSNTMKYNEWLERRNGNSIKQKLQEEVDKYILDEDVHTLDDLAEKFRAEGCEVRFGKFMTIKPKNSKRAYRTENFDKKYGGYSIKELEYRIEHKDKEISDEAISRLSGLQREYAIQMRIMQISVFKHKSKKVRYSDLVKSAELLTFLTDNKIQSFDDLKNVVNERDENYRTTKNKVKQLNERLAYLVERGERSDFQLIEKLKLEVNDLEEKSGEYLKESSEASKMYRYYLSKQEQNNITDFNNDEEIINRHSNIR